MILILDTILTWVLGAIMSLGALAAFLILIKIFIYPWIK